MNDTWMILYMNVWKQASFKLASISANRASSLGNGLDLRLHKITKPHRSYLSRTSSSISPESSGKSQSLQVQWIPPGANWRKQNYSKFKGAYIERTVQQGVVKSAGSLPLIYIPCMRSNVCMLSMCVTPCYTTNHKIFDLHSWLAKTSTIVWHSFQHCPGFAVAPECGSSTAHSCWQLKLNKIQWLSTHAMQWSMKNVALRRAKGAWAEMRGESSWLSLCIVWPRKRHDLR